MTPSKEAIEAAALEMYSDYENEVPKILEAAYAIDVAPLELCYSLLQKERDCDGQTIKDLEQRIKELEATAKKFKTLCEAVDGGDDKCLPECDEYFHAEKCPVCDSAYLIINLQNHIKELEAELAPLVVREIALEAENTELRLEVEPMKMSYAEQIDILASLRDENEMLKQERGKLLAEIDTHAHIAMTAAKQRNKLEQRIKGLEAERINNLADEVNLEHEVQVLKSGDVWRLKKDLEERVKELEAENARLKEALDPRHGVVCNCYRCRRFREATAKAQLERGGGDVE